MPLTFVGLDLAKTVFQVHGIDHAGKPQLSKRMQRHAVLNFFANLPACVVGVEACATAHYWGREIAKLGHTVKLMPPKYVKPYVKRHKNDQVDAEAICEAVQRPTMRFVPIKTPQQQAALVIHRVRETLVRQKTQLVNALRGHMAEFGVIAPQGVRHVSELKRELAETECEALPAQARSTLSILVDQMEDTDRRIGELDDQLAEHAKSDDACRRLMAIPGIGPINATALVATIGDANTFESGRQLGAWIGLVPRQSSSGCKERLGHITKAGDAYLRRMLINGARVVVRWRRKTWPWLAQLLARRPANVAIVALAHKLARIVWAVLSRGETYSPIMVHDAPPSDDNGAVLAPDKAKPLTRRPKRPALSDAARGAA